MSERQLLAVRGLSSDRPFQHLQKLVHNVSAQVVLRVINFPHQIVSLLFGKRALFATYFFVVGGSARSYGTDKHVVQCAATYEKLQ